MKKILSLVLVSALGGALTLGAYKLFLEEEKTVVVNTTETKPNFIPTTNNSSVYKSYETPDFTTAAENTVNAVVHVKNVTMSSGQMTFEDLFFGRRPQRAQMGTGSGVIINKDGYIITNNHVIDKSQELSVTLNNNKTYSAEIIGTDPKTDIALLKIDADEDLPYVTFGDSDHAKIGEWVLAVGNPFNLTSTVTAGIISAKARDLSGNSSQSFIQTDAAVNPGNSGGALVNTHGELVGINTAISSQTGSYIGYSFAVPSNIAKKVIEDIMEFGNVQNGILGIEILPKEHKKAIELNVHDIEGVYISKIFPDSGADKANLKEGDIIKEIDNVKISKFSSLKGHLSSKRPGDIVNVTFLRDNEYKTVPVKLSKTDSFTVKFLKMELQDLTNTFKEDYQIDYGVMVKSTKNKWLYSNLGISEGYIITGINDIKIENIDDISKLKDKYGDDILDEIKKLEYINTSKEKKEVIFR